jgi:ABC-type polysaccharide/polyol phosphate export permease
LGLLAASRARTIEAVSGLISLTTVPLFLMSGVFFASDNFPDLAQPLIQVLPLTALNDGLRAVILNGANAADLAGEAAILAVWTVATFTAALCVFRWQ